MQWHINNVFRNWLLSGLTIEHVGGYAIWLEKGDFNNTIIYANIHDLGAGGVRAGSLSNSVALISS